MVDETELDIMDADHESRLNDTSFDCPQCGDECDELVEGVCSFCATENQQQLDQHNASFDRWEKLTDGQRDSEIKRAYT